MNIRIFKNKNARYVVKTKQKVKITIRKNKNIAK
jgi:hypothetical protein